MNLTFTKATTMYRTPVKTGESSPGSRVLPRSIEMAGPSLSSVRRSVVEWGAGKTELQAKAPANLKRDATPPVPMTLEKRRASGEVTRSPKVPEARFLSLTAEARACLNKAKLHLGNSRNLKTEIRTGVTEAIHRLYELVKESERRKAPTMPVPAVAPVAAHAVAPAVMPVATPAVATVVTPPNPTTYPTELMETLVAGLKEHRKALQECQQHTQALSEQVRQAPCCALSQGPTFAQMAAVPKQNIPEPLHSVVVSSVNDQDTGEEVLEKLKTAVDARNEGIRVERLRKARDQKVVVGFKTREEMTRVTERIRRAGNLVVEEVKNKDPLVIIRDVLSCHTDTELLQSLQRQNTHLIGDIPAGELRLGVKYRRKTRNPHMCHVILQVSPPVWQMLTLAGRVHIDLQRVRVLDQSPLVQCTRCLCFGHSRKLCTRPADLCVHCGDPHMQADCPSRLASETPRCHNCLTAKMNRVDHNAFDSSCTVRIKWDALARLSVAYC